MLYDEMIPTNSHIISTGTSPRPGLVMSSSKPKLQSRRVSLDLAGQGSSTNKKKKTGHTLFPTKLRALIDDAAREGNEHLIAWLPGGTAFKIPDPDAFADQLLKRYFRQNRFKSFTRQLYLYGFVKLENEAGAFSHPHFLRDDINLCHSIDRTNARTHFNVIQDSLKAVSPILRESGDRRYMRNKLLKEVKKDTSSDSDDMEMESSSTSSRDYRSGRCTSPSNMDFEGSLLRQQQQSYNVVSPYACDDEIIDESVSIAETRDWLATVEQSFTGANEPSSISAHPGMNFMEPTPMKEEEMLMAAVSQQQQHHFLATPSRVTSDFWEFVSPPPF